MRGSEFLDKLELLDPELIEAAGREPVKRAGAWNKLRSLPVFSKGKPPETVETPQESRPPRRFGIGGLAAAALCVCALLLPVFLTRNAGFLETAKSGDTPSAYAHYQDWRQDMKPEEYFQHNPIETQGEVGIYLPGGVNHPKEGQEDGYAFTLMDEGDWRNYDPGFCAIGSGQPFPISLEDLRYAAPSLAVSDDAEEFPYLYQNTVGSVLFDSQEKAQEYRIDWGLETRDHRALRFFIAGSKERGEWPEFEEYVESSQGETITVREGVEIRAIGQEGFEKALWYQKDGIWTRIAATADTTLEEIIIALDFFWENPIDLDSLDIQFFPESTSRDIGEIPEELAPYFVEDPRWGVRSSIEVGAFDEHGNTMNHGVEYQSNPDTLLKCWIVDKTRRANLSIRSCRIGGYVYARHIGDLYDITEEQVRDFVAAHEKDMCKMFAFDWDGLLVYAEYQSTADTAGDMWSLFTFLQEEMGQRGGAFVEQELSSVAKGTQLFAHTSTGVSSYAAGDYFLPPNRTEEVYFSRYLDDQFVEQKVEIPGPWETIGCKGYFEGSSLEKTVITFVPGHNPDGGKTFMLAMGPGVDNFSPLLREGKKSGMTLTHTQDPGYDYFAVGGGEGQAKLLGFQSEDNWYVLMGMADADPDLMFTVAAEIQGMGLAFPRDQGTTYETTTLTAGEILEMAEGAGRCDFVHDTEENSFTPEILGAELTTEKRPDGAQEDVRATFTLAKDPGKLVQSIEWFVSSDLRWLSDTEWTQIFDVNEYREITGQVERDQYIQEHCGGDKLVLERDFTNVVIGLKPGASTQEIDMYIQTIVYEMQFSQRIARETAVENRQALWKKLNDLYYSDGQPPLGELTLHYTTGYANYIYGDDQIVGDFPRDGEDPCAGRLGYLTQEDIELYMAREDMPTMQQDGKNYDIFQFQWGGMMAKASIQPQATSAQVYKFLANLQNMANAASLEVSFPMVDSVAGQSELLGGESAWKEPMLAAVSQWVQEKQNFQDDGFFIKSLRLIEATSNGGGALVSARVVHSGAQDGPGNTVFFEGEGWFTYSQLFILKKTGSSWKVLRADTGESGVNLAEEIAKS